MKNQFTDSIQFNFFRSTKRWQFIMILIGSQAKIPNFGVFLNLDTS